MPFALQAKLLRFLDQWTVRAVGSASEETVDVQVVSATNSSLEQAVADRRFRPDLLYRLRGVEITLPPLRQRSDFLQAVHSLLAPHGTDCPISDETIDAMRQHNWPGNFRELKNFILRMILVANSSVLLPSDVARVFDLTNVPLKPVMAGLPLGGGKAVILADPRKEKTPELLMAFAERVARLGGTFTTGEDVGTTVADIEAILRSPLDSPLVAHRFPSTIRFAFAAF
jgi:transcriptional regulator with PAS, ATPase and Fis domain